ncbi:MBG domain-containing protein [Lacticaseibacillus rhamnosus]
MKHSSKRVQSIQQAEKTVHVRFRMYKAKKRWLIAGTALLLMPAFFQPGQEVHADSKSPQTTAVTSQSGATAETTAKTATGNTQPAGTTTQNTAAASSSAAVNAASSATQSSASSTASSAVASTGDSAASTSDATDSKSLATDSAAVKPQTVTQEDRSLASAAVQTTSATASSASSSASSQASSAAQSATTTQASTQAPANATAAESTQTIGDYTYSLDTANGTATVTGRANANVTDINIGASVTYNGQTFKVTAINNGAFATLNNLGNVNVADTVTSIGENAFAYSQFTGNITIENAESLGKAAFAGIKAGSVTLKKTANISERAFYFANVKDITIADAKTIETQAFFGLTASSLKIDGQADISESAFESANIAGDVTVNNAQTIDKNAFASLKAQALTINGQTDIGEGAFIYAQITGSVNITGANTIGDNAFQFAKVTDAINVPDSVALGEKAFYQVYAASLSLNGAATTFGNQAFAMSRIGQVTINAATIDQQAFYHLYTDQLTFGDDVRVITDGAFQFIENTKELPQIDGKDNPENQITTLNLPANIKTITNAAFYVAKITTIAVAPASQLTTLGYQAFAFSTATSMNMPDSLEQIGDQAFYGGKLVKVAFGPKLQSIGNLAFAEFGPLTNVDFTRAAALETIGDSAFAYNTINNAIVFPAKLHTIGNAAFVGNRIPALTLNSGLQTIGDTAFGYNQIQNELVVPDSVTDIGKYAFVYNSISNLTLGNGLKTIGQEAFEANVILNALTIPSSVTTIGAKAFNVNLMPKVIIAGTPVIGKEAFSTNRITVLQASTAQPATPDALNQSADAYTDSAHVSLSDFFDVAISGVTHQDIVVSNIKGSNGVKVTFDTASKSFKMPAQTQGFSFDWSLKGNDGVTYTGHYNIHLDDPVIRAHDISLFTGQVWKPELNFIDAVKQDGTSVPLSELTWTVTDENGKIVAEKDKDGIVTGDVDNTQPTTYTVTYTYGAESASAKIYYNQRLAASYALVGTQTATATGQPITVDTKLFSLSLGEGFDAGTLQLSDLNFFDANGNQAAADALTATGVYTVELSQAAWDRIAKLTNDSGQSAANFNFTGTSTAQLIIGLTATGKLGNGGFVYDGTTLASQAKDLAVTVVLSDGTQQTMNLTATDITLVEKDSENAGTYHYLLNSVGLARLQDLLGETVTIDQTEINQVSGTITITPADATVTGNNVSFVYDGQTRASDAKGIQATLKLGNTSRSVALTSSDIVVNNDGLNAGHYSYKLSDAGIAKLQQAAGSNYLVDTTDLAGTVTITPATATATGNDVSFIYDGQTKASGAKGIQATLKLGDTEQRVALSSADIVVNNDSVNAGQYSYKLSEIGIAKLQQAAGTNYQLSTTDLAGNITITPAVATADSNDVSFEYDGKTKASEAAGIQATIKLDTGKVVDLTATDIIVANDDVNAGQYSYQLSDAGKAKLQAATGNSYQLTADDLAKVTGTITITPAVAAANSNDVSFEYDGKTKASEAAGIQATIKLDTGKVVDLTATDIIVANDDVNAGQYSYQLSDAGKAKLQAVTGNNYQLTADDLAKVMGTITITPAAVTTDSNDVSFEYDGKTKASEAKGIQVTVKLGETEKTVDLTSADIVVANDDVNAGQYSYQLSDAGKAKLQAATGNNYQLTADDLAKIAGTITITPATTTVDSNDVSFEYDGKTKASEAKGIQATIKLGEIEKTVDLSSADIIVANDGVIVGKYTYSLSDSGKSKLQAATGSNYQLTTEALDKVSGSITITPAGAIATGKDAHFEYDGKTKASEAKGIQAILTIDGTEKTVDLTSGDIIVADDSVDAGKYSYRLSDAGKAKLQGEAGSDHQLTADDLAKVTGTITITPAIATADSNDVSFEYNGKTKASEAKGIQVTVKLGETEKTVELTSADIVAINDDVNAGQYIYELSDAGKAKLQAVTGNNYQLTADDLAKIAGTITITPAAASVDSNDVSFEYDGKTKASEAKGIQVTVKLGETEKTVDLNSADIVIENDGVDAGKYSYQLSDAGKSKLQTAVGNNYQLTAEELVKVTGTITITPAVTTADSNDVSFEYDGKTKASEVKGIQATVMLGKSGQVVALTSADVVVVNDGVDAGKYSYQLSDAGKAKLQAVTGNNYQLTADDLAKVTGTITITPATTTVDSNDVSFEYDGKTKASEVKDIQATIALGETEKTVDLTSADIVVANDDVNAGQYSYQLSDAGKAKLQAATGNNYQLTADDLAKVAGTITITPAITTVDSNDVSFEYDGKTKASEAKGIQATVKLGESEKTVDLTSADIIVANDGVTVGKYTYSLSSSGKAKLQTATGNNYQLTADDLAKVAGTITITPATTSVDSNDVSFEYDGKTKASEAKGIQVTIKLGESGQVVALTSTDIVVVNDGVNVGQYIYKLSDAGKAKLQTATGNNYQLTADDLAKVTGTVTITPAIATANSNDVSFEYDGKTKASEAKGIQAVVKLGESEKTVDLTSADIIVANDGATVGKYTYSLSDSGKAKLIAATGNNYQLTVDDLAKVAGAITITPATASVDSNDVSFEYDGKTKASEAKGIQATVTLGETKKTVELTSADIVVENDDVDAGKYSYQLSDAGKAKLQAATGNNYQLTADDLAKVTGTITITPATTSVDSNDVSFEYDGKTKASEAQGIQATVKLGKNGKTVALTAADIVVVNDGVNAGQYDYKLSAAGMTKLRQATGTNYQFKKEDLIKLGGTVTITPATALADLNDVSFSYDGQTKASQAHDLTANIKLGTKVVSVHLNATDIVVTDDGVGVGQYQYSLDANGIAKLRQASGDNYQFDAKVLAGLTGTITIKPVTGAVTVNDTSFVYDGHTKASAAAGLQASLYLPQAEAKATIQLTREDILVTNDGTAAGTYRYRLSQTGIAKLQKAVGKNYELDQDELAGLTGTITITPLTVNATVNHGQFQYNGVTRASQAGGLAITVQLPEKSQKIALTNTDIAVENDSVNVGTYTYHLTASGLAKLAVAIGPNYQVTDQTFSGTITITPAPISATLSGLQKKTYDGQPGALNDDYYRLVLSDGTEIQLQAGDLIFVDGQAPVNPGSYAVTLSTSGLQRIKALLPNNLLKNVNTQQAIFEIVALPSPDPGTGTTPDTPGHHLPDTGTDTGTTPGTPDHHLPNTGTGTQQSEISTHNGTKHRLPQTGDTQSQTLSLMGLLLATMSGLFGLAGRKRKAHR